MRLNMPMNATRIVSAKQTKHELDYGHPLTQKCPDCGRHLERAGVDLVYCDCGAEFFATREHRNSSRLYLRRVPS